jgi:hypothetical protein
MILLTFARFVVWSLNEREVCLFLGRQRLPVYDLPHQLYLRRECIDIGLLPLNLKCAKFARTGAVSVSR